MPAEGPAPVAPAALGATVREAAAAGAPSAAEVDEDAVDEAATEVVAPEPAAPEAEADARPAAPVGRSTDVAGARIVALQWAMDGRPREETDGYLAEHYDLRDRAGLLDQVYAIATRA